MMQVSKRIPFDDPQVLNLCRAGYVISNLIILAITLYIKFVVDKKKGTSTINRNTRTPLLTYRPPDMTTLKYVEPAPMGSSEEPKLVTTTVHAYDLGQIKTMLRSQLMGVGMMGVMHFYFKYTNPLLIQSIIPLKGAFESNMTKIHLFGQPASGELKRPFKAAQGFMSGLSGGAAASDKAAIEAAEKAGRGGAKEE
jgi:SRP-independent targeting protein 3